MLSVMYYLVAQFMEEIMGKNRDQAEKLFDELERRVVESVLKQFGKMCEIRLSKKVRRNLWKSSQSDCIPIKTLISNIEPQLVELMRADDVGEFADPLWLGHTYN